VQPGQFLFVLPGFQFPLATGILFHELPPSAKSPTAPFAGLAEIPMS
jgi:hypothetical protein